MAAVSELANSIFNAVVTQYHILDNIEQDFHNPYPETEYLKQLLYRKCWIDTVQWHVEDLVRDPQIDPALGLQYKRQIDRLNQDRTDTVERIDDYYLQCFAAVTLQPNARVNTESPAWAIDRLSILSLKIYHMQVEAARQDLSAEKQAACQQKLQLLLEQRTDLSLSIDELLQDIADGKKKMKVYRQMKMYNDPEMNPVLYGKAKS